MSVNTAAFQDVLEDFLHPYFKAKYVDNTFVFRHALASLHVVESVK